MELTDTEILIWTGYQPRKMWNQAADREALLRSLAGQGLNRTEAAAAMGISYRYLIELASKHGIKFVRKVGSGAGRTTDTAREADMVYRYKSGEFLQAIGDRYGVTRERVRQIISKAEGLTGKDGGQSVNAKVRATKRRLMAERQCREKRGCSLAEYKSLCDMGKAMMAAGEGRVTTPTYAFITHRANARRCGVEWDLKLWDWWQVWQRSGLWNERGRGKGAWMQRRDKTKGFVPGNVYITRGGEHRCFNRS
jgi:hypothetical protein